MAEGWARQALQVPEGMARRFTGEADRYGPNSVKLLGTLALGILLGMPKAQRDDLYIWITRRLWDGDEDLSSEEIWRQVERVVAAKPPSDGCIDTRAVQPSVGPGGTHQVTRLLDPSVSLPPTLRTKKAKGA